MSKKLAVLAYTKNSNTTQSDSLYKVPHIVEFDDGSKIEIMATDPSGAIDKVNKIYMNK